MVSKLRLVRIGDRIRDDLAEILLQEVLDPRIGGVFITGVKVDRELAFADIHVSALEGSERAGEILEGLRHAQGFLRKSLSQRIELRTFPRLRFHWDPTAERAARIEEIISTLHTQEIDLQPDVDESEEEDAAE